MITPTTKVIDAMTAAADTDAELHHAMERVSIFDLVRLVRATQYAVEEVRDAESSAFR